MIRKYDTLRFFLLLVRVLYRHRGDEVPGSPLPQRRDADLDLQKGAVCHSGKSAHKRFSDSLASLSDDLDTDGVTYPRRFVVICISTVHVPVFTSMNNRLYQ